RHHIGFERTLTGALYPDNIGMLYLLAIGLRGASLAQVINWFMGVTVLCAIWCFCRNYFNCAVGVWAAAFFAFMPVFVFFSPLGYVDIGVAMFQLLGLWALYKWLLGGGRGTLLLTAVFMGLAMGSKHTAIFLAIIAAAIIGGTSLYRKEGVRSAAVQVLQYALVALGLAVPWYARALIEAGNPVWPVANGLFGGLPYGGSYSVSSGIVAGGSVDFMKRLSDLLASAGASLWAWAWDGRLGWQRATGVYFVALLPGLVVYWRQGRVRWMAMVCLVYYLLVVFLIDGNPRYNLAFFALLSILAGFIAEQFARQRLRVLALVFKGIFAATFLANLGQNYAWAYRAVDYAASSQTSEGFLINNEGNYQAFRFVEQHLPPDAKVLLQGIVKGYYCERLYMWDHPYQMALQYRDHPTPDDLLGEIRRLGITHIMRMIYIPPGRVKGVGYPQYFADAQHEAFRKKHLKLLYRDQQYVVFKVVYPA
ncbi:MAG: glycosyltransferase family 39 protein, partial [Candidatus Latescibacterota bacterium]|nr:glycosyltransferase family 39 protein [Candidatus Latescibacterota bacterium]